MDYQSKFQDYLNYCAKQKHLDFKTVKAYRIDIKQYLDFVVNNHADINRESIDEYLSYLNQTFKPKSVKRKIAAIKSFFSYIGFTEKHGNSEMRSINNARMA